MMESILRIRELNKSFRRPGGETYAVRHFSADIREGSCLGLVGESGCGKSTVAGMIAGFIRPDSGRICFLGETLAFHGKKAQRQRQHMQMIFQNPLSSMNPHMTVLENLRETVLYYDKERVCSVEAEAEKGLQSVGLDSAFLSRYPAELSGGECQRVAIVRSLLRRPRLLICDEMTSALDVSVQAEIMRQMIRIREEQKIAMLFITHDLSLAAHICDEMVVMRQGEIIESGMTEQILHSPHKEYTSKLVRVSR